MTRLEQKAAKWPEVTCVSRRISWVSFKCVLSPRVSLAFEIAFVNSVSDTAHRLCSSMDAVRSSRLCGCVGSTRGCTTSSAVIRCWLMLNVNHQSIAASVDNRRLQLQQPSSRLAALWHTGDQDIILSTADSLIRDLRPAPDSTTRCYCLPAVLSEHTR